ncbi:MAG: hypothetical protein OXU54_05190, partial [Gammaproteobacteria bacterium]|nr:hypothetical protein [Gammaproteobacteria bacterium]
RGHRPRAAGVSALEQRLAGPRADAPDPERAALRLEALLRVPGFRRRLAELPDPALAGLLRVLGLCDFLFRFLRRHPEAVGLCGSPPSLERVAECRDPAALRQVKYEELLKLCCLELAGEWSCAQSLSFLSALAEAAVRRALDWALEAEGDAPPFAGAAVPCVLALGKLGAGELNFSSDVDLVFVAPEAQEISGDYQAYLRLAGTRLAVLERLLEERTSNGFLYRVDLRLRPWGEAGPPLLSSEALESYYAAYADPWDRLAWLRARPIAGCRARGEELLRRMRSFLYLRSLSSAELQRLWQLKQEIAKRRLRPDAWDVKAGEGGIRDLEFFVHVLQILYGARQPALRTAGTLQALQGLEGCGLLRPGEGQQIRDCYLYLRALENRLQMMDEQQLHWLPNGRAPRRQLARSLHPGQADPARLFEERLEWCRALARSCFERVLPGQPEGLEILED